MLYCLDIYKTKYSKTWDARHYIRFETTEDLNRVINYYNSIGKYVNYYVTNTIYA